MALVQRIQNICLKPKQEWEVIAGETSSTAELLKNYALPLAAIGAIAGFIGLSFIGISVPFVGQYRVPIGSGLAGAIVGLGVQVASVFILSLIINELAPKFGGEKNSAQALKIAVYSSTPGWAAAVLRILPSLGVLSGLAALYGIYLLYLGLPRLMKSPQERSVTYTVVVVACAIGIFLVAGLITGAIVGGGMMAAGAVPAGLR
jgi:hypothetical protein